MSKIDQFFPVPFTDITIIFALYSEISIFYDVSFIIRCLRLWSGRLPKEISKEKKIRRSRKSINFYQIVFEYLVKKM